MTPDQLTNTVTLGVATAGAVFYDTLAWRGVPALASFIAYVPLAARRLTVSPRARASLADGGDGGTYRSAPARAIDWRRLPGPTRFEVDGARVDLDPSRGRLSVRLPFVPWWFGFGGVVVMRLRDDGDHVSVTARLAPWLSLSSIGFFGALLAMAARDGNVQVVATFAALLLVCNALGVYRTRGLAVPTAEAVVRILQSRLASLDGVA